MDSDERKQFAQVAHEYLIDQVQFTGAESYAQTNVNQRLNFNHPCKALYFAAQLQSNVQSVSAAGSLANRWTDFTSGTTPYEGTDILASAALLINGGQRFAPRYGIYFNQVQPYQHFPRGPCVGVYVYSFALKPAEFQPSGSINMSRIDNATFQYTFTTNSPINVFVFATNTNVLRVMNGIVRGRKCVLTKFNMQVKLITINFATLSNCGKSLKTNKYQNVSEMINWPRKELGYGNNFISLSNLQPIILITNNGSTTKCLRNVQRTFQDIVYSLLNMSKDRVSKWQDWLIAINLKINFYSYLDILKIKTYKYQLCMFLF